MLDVIHGRSEVPDVSRVRMIYSPSRVRILLLMLYSEPTNVVLYTLTESGYIGFYDPDASEADKNGDLYFVARSLRPVAVAYDPLDKVILLPFTVSVVHCWE